MFSGWEDGSLLEAASWRLASELSRRHPTATRLIRGHPGGGQSDCLWLLPAADGPGDVRLNRNGTIQVLERFDGRETEWQPTEWDTYFRADPRSFLLALEADAGLPAPPKVPGRTPRTLTLRVLAAIAATGVKAIAAIEIAPGYVDTSGYGGGPNEDLFAAFPAVPAHLRLPQSDDLLGIPEYRFWFVVRAGEPILAFEQQTGAAWTKQHDVAWNLDQLYQESRNHLLVTALKLLRRVDHV